jgi:hypothetical protein
MPIYVGIPEEMVASLRDHKQQEKISEKQYEQKKRCLLDVQMKGCRLDSHRSNQCLSKGIAVGFGHSFAVPDVHLMIIFGDDGKSRREFFAVSRAFVAWITSMVKAITHWFFHMQASNSAYRGRAALTLRCIRPPTPQIIARTKQGTDPVPALGHEEWVQGVTLIRTRWFLPLDGSACPPYGALILRENRLLRLSGMLAGEKPSTSPAPIWRTALQLLDFRSYVIEIRRSGAR